MNCEESGETYPNIILKDRDWVPGGPYPAITLQFVIGVRKNLPNHNLKDCAGNQEDLTQP